MPMSALVIFLATFVATDDGIPPWRDIQNCGTNCLYAMLKLHDKPVRYEILREEIPVTKEGCTLADLYRVARKHGLNAKVVRAPLDDVLERVPCVVHIDQADASTGHFVLLLGQEGDQVFIAETVAAGVARTSRSEFMEIWTGTALIGPSMFDRLRMPILVGLIGMIVCIAWVSFCGKGPALGRWFAIRRDEAVP